MQILFKLIEERLDEITECILVLKMHFEPTANCSQLFQITMMNFKNIQLLNQFSITSKYSS